MGERLSRYSVQITLDETLLEVKSQTHDLCCAWGFRWNNSEDTIYNVVGWVSSMSTPIETIAWDETYSVTASAKGRRHGEMVDKAMEPKPISLGQLFTVTDFRHASVEDNPETADSKVFAYRIAIPCSIVLTIALDLGGSTVDNLTPVFIASAGKETLDLSIKTGVIEPTKTLMFFFARKGRIMRRNGLDLMYLENPEIIYDYGNQSTRFTKIKLVYKDSKPQLSTEVEAKASESFLWRRR